MRAPGLPNTLGLSFNQDRRLEKTQGKNEDTRNRYLFFLDMFLGPVLTANEYELSVVLKQRTNPRRKLTIFRVSWRVSAQFSPMKMTL